MIRLGQAAAAASAEAPGGQHKGAAEHAQQLALLSAEVAIRACAEDAAKGASSQQWWHMASIIVSLCVGLLLWSCLPELAAHTLDLQKGLSKAGVLSQIPYISYTGSASSKAETSMSSLLYYNQHNHKSAGIDMESVAPSSMYRCKWMNDHMLIE